MNKTGKISISVSKRGSDGNPLGRIRYKTCPLCASLEFQTIKTVNCEKHRLYKPVIDPDMVWKKCAACGHVFTEGYFAPDTFSAIFSSTHDIQVVGTDMERQRFVSARMVDKVLMHIKSGHWLDIGFGNASLLLTAEEFGFTGVGIDMRQENVRALRDWGLEAHCGDLRSLEHPERYDAISMADVLEHFPFPKEGLEQAYRLLKKDGVLLISMPNDESALWKHLDLAGNNPYWAELEHFHNFGRKRLYRLLQQHNFEPVSYGVSERYRACMEVIARKKIS